MVLAPMYATTLLGKDLIYEGIETMMAWVVFSTWRAAWKRPDLWRDWDTVLPGHIAPTRKPWKRPDLWRDWDRCCIDLKYYKGFRTWKRPDLWRDWDSFACLIVNPIVFTSLEKTWFMKGLRPKPLRPGVLIPGNSWKRPDLWRDWDHQLLGWHRWNFRLRLEKTWFMKGLRLIDNTSELDISFTSWKRPDLWRDWDMILSPFLFSSHQLGKDLIYEGIETHPLSGLI